MIRSYGDIFKRSHVLVGGLMLVLAACAPADGLDNVRGQPVPTATFLFFDKNSATLQPDSIPALREAAAYLVQYDNTFARIVGHLAPDESTSGAVEQRLDTQRSMTVGSQLMELGVQAGRIQPFSAGRSENMSSTAGDVDIDRRVDIIFVVN
jgi:outer membrane protein OmpA-like peptidoglycan-associated protein